MLSGREVLAQDGVSVVHGSTSRRERVFFFFSRSEVGGGRGFDESILSSAGDSSARVFEVFL